MQISVLLILLLTVQLSHQGGGGGGGGTLSACGPANPCENGGNCGPTGCECLKGFIGDFCQHEVKILVPVPQEYSEGTTVSIDVERPVAGFVLRLSVSASGSADPGDDFLQLAPELNFQQADTMVNLQVNIIDDDIPEGDETIIFTLTADDGTTAEIMITIKDNDLALTVPDQLGVRERSGSIEIKITSPAMAYDVTVQVNTGIYGGATYTAAASGTDFTPLINHDVTISAGSTTASFMITIKDNEDKDGDKAFTFTITGDAIAASGPHTVFILDDDGGRSFDCRRHTSGCAAETDKCGSLPMCTCVGTPAREGVMCNIITDQKNGPACTANNVDCNEHGVCLDDGGTTSCACYPSYYGENCEYTRLSAVCLRDSMIFLANPHKDFSGSIHVKGKSAKSECVATQVSNLEDPNNLIADAVQGYGVNVPHKSESCGEITAEEFVKDGTEYIQFKRFFFIQYQTSPNVATGLDQLVTVTCKFEKNNVLVNAGVLTLNPESQFTEESTSKTFSPLAFTVTELDADGNPVIITEASTVPIAKELCVTLSIPEDLGALEVLHVEFNNTKLDTPEKWKIYDEGCLDKDYNRITFEKPWYPGGNKRVIKFCFSAFAFLNSDKLTIEVKLKICLDPDECQLGTCSPSPTFRRKRQADSSREETVGRTFTLSTGSDEATGNTSGQTDGDEVKKEAVCNLPFEFIPTVIALAAVIFLLVLLCLYLTYRLVRKPSLKAKKPKESVYFKR